MRNLALVSISLTLAGSLVSCGNGGETPEGGSGEATEDDEAILVSDLSAEAIADVTTVVRVRFTTSEPVRARVEFGDDELRDHTTGWTETGTSHELLLLGMSPDGEVSYQVVLTKADKPKSEELAKVMEKVAAELAKHPAAYPEILVTSSREGHGLSELRAAVAACAETGVSP